MKRGYSKFIVFLTAIVVSSSLFMAASDLRCTPSDLSNCIVGEACVAGYCGYLFTFLTGEADPAVPAYLGEIITAEKLCSDKTGGTHPIAVTIGQPAGSFNNLLCSQVKYWDNEIKQWIVRSGCPNGQNTLMLGIIRTLGCRRKLAGELARLEIPSSQLVQVWPKVSGIFSNPAQYNWGYDIPTATKICSDSAYNDAGISYTTAVNFKMPLGYWTPSDQMLKFWNDQANIFYDLPGSVTPGKSFSWIRRDGSLYCANIVLRPQCSNGIDDDGDGKFDFCLSDGTNAATCDPDCKDSSDNNEKPECSDGEDNDGDGKFDFCLSDGSNAATCDPDCGSPGDNDETSVCSNGIDDDGDGLIDSNDPDCPNGDEFPFCINQDNVLIKLDKGSFASGALWNYAGYNYLLCYEKIFRNPYVPDSGNIKISCKLFDINKDGTIDFGDLASVSSCLTNSNLNFCKVFDFNYDGCISSAESTDLMGFGKCWGNPNKVIDYNEGPEDPHRCKGDESNPDNIVVWLNNPDNAEGSKNRVGIISNADLNKDGRVTNLDRLAFFAKFSLPSLSQVRLGDTCNCNNNFCNYADLNRDGVLDQLDFNFLVDEYVSDCFNYVPIDPLGKDTAYTKAIRDSLNIAGSYGCDASNLYCEGMDIDIDGRLTPTDILNIVNKLIDVCSYKDVYVYPVCFDDLRCDVVDVSSGNCPNGEQLVLRMTTVDGGKFASPTHPDFASFPIGVCCTVPVPLDPSLNEGHWEDLLCNVIPDTRNYGLGNKVKLVVSGTDLTGVDIDFVVKKQQTLAGVDWFWPDSVVVNVPGIGTSVSWEAGKKDDGTSSIGTYYFTATVQGTTKTVQSGFLNVVASSSTPHIEICDTSQLAAGADCGLDNRCSDDVSGRLSLIENKQIYFKDENLGFRINRKTSYVDGDFEFIWDLGNGVVKRGSTSTNLDSLDFDHAFSDTGQKNIVLIIKDSNNQVSMDRKSILAIDSAFALAYIDSPEWGSFYDNTMNFDARSSYAIDEAIDAAGVRTITCLGGFCPKTTKGCPPSYDLSACPITVQNAPDCIEGCPFPLVPASYNNLEFLWSFRLENNPLVWFEEDVNYGYRFTKQFPSREQWRAKLKVRTP